MTNGARMVSVHEPIIDPTSYWKADGSATLTYSALAPEDTERTHLNGIEDDEELEGKPLRRTSVCLRELAYAATTIGITMREEGTCEVEESVYGAAIVMPQLARTVGWNKTFTALALRSFFFLLLNVSLQAFLLMMIAKEEAVMDVFGGQMHLCDFGIALDKCPGPGCRGPFGTDITPPRLFKWASIMNRNFVKESLIHLFPDKMDEINEKIDTGEYGVESNSCRYACCFIFMISCMDELVYIWKMLQLLYQIPTKGEPWISPREGVHPSGKIEDVRMFIAGMPFVWKLITLLFVIFPKFLLWKLTVETGITFLMNTSAIDELIVNSVAVTFILAIDELIMTALMSDEAIQFVKATEGYALYDEKTSCVGDMSLLTDDELVSRYKKEQIGFRSIRLKDISYLLPFKFIISLLGTCLFVFEYYYRNCILDDQDGTHRLVSEPMYMPKSTAYSWRNALLPRFFPVSTEDESFWQMPSGSP